MWRLVPLLAVLGCLEILVPWPDVATLVLSKARHVDTPVISLYEVAPVVMRHEPSQLLVQVRDTTP